MGTPSGDSQNKEITHFELVPTTSKEQRYHLDPE